MAAAVLDASAVLAVYLLEPGCEVVQAALPDARISAVNAAEILSKLVERGASERLRRLAERSIRDLIVPFDLDLALRVARLLPLTRPLGLSLGDRACLALAEREGLPVLTADKQWARLQLGVAIRVIR